MSKMSFLNAQFSISKPSSFSSPKPNQRPNRNPDPKPKPTKSNSSHYNFRQTPEETKKIFDKFDHNGDGKISQDEYNQALKVLGGSQTTSEETAAAFRAADADGDGFIDIEEFVRVQNMDGGVKRSEIQSAFRVFDLDGNGKISAEELLEVLKRLGEKHSLKACKMMIKGADRDGDGLIDMDEFMSMMMNQTMKV